MSLFRCEKCNRIENTATSGYNWKEPDAPALCMDCDPQFPNDHNHFEKRLYTEADRDNVLNPPIK